MPRALRDRPLLKAHNRRYLEAFYELSAGRSFGEMPQPIPTSEIARYCEFFRIDSQPERERLFVVLRRLDAAYLRRMAEKVESPAPKKA